MPAVLQAHAELFTTLAEGLVEDYVIVFSVHSCKDVEVFMRKVRGGKPTIFLQNEFSVYALPAVSDVLLVFKPSTVTTALVLDIPVLTYGICNLPGMRAFYNRYTSVEQVYSLNDIRAILGRRDNSTFQENLRKRVPQTRSSSACSTGTSHCEWRS